MMVRYTLVIAALGIAGCGRSSEDKPPPPSPELEIAQSALENAERLGFEDANVERGMRVAIGTEEACASRSRCFSCYQCHGMRGEGSANANFPRLSNQSYVYLKQSLRDFASGRRPNPTMQEVVRGWTEQQLNDAAAYYSAVTPRVALRARSNDEALEMRTEGRRLASEGSSEPAIQACAECHGSDQAEPAAPIYPYLAGQHRGYLEIQLRAFRDGAREDPTQIMNHVAQQLTDEQIQAVARYYASLPPPELSSETRDLAASRLPCSGRICSDRGRVRVPQLVLQERLLRRSFASQPSARR